MVESSKGSRGARPGDPAIDHRRRAVSARGGAEREVRSQVRGRVLEDPGHDPQAMGQPGCVGQADGRGAGPFARIREGEDDRRPVVVPVEFQA